MEHEPVDVRIIETIKDKIILLIFRGDQNSRSVVLDNTASHIQNVEVPWLLLKDKPDKEIHKLL